MKKCTHILYFLNGSIGDFLMVLFLMENIHHNDPSLNLHILTPRNLSLFQELGATYPYVKIHRADRKNVGTIMRLFLKEKNCCITPPTPGRLPLSTKLMSRMLSWRGALIGFNDTSRVNGFLYTQRLTHDYSRLYYEVLLDILAVFGFTRKIPVPRLHFNDAPEALKKWHVEPQKYIMLHPFGSASSRSILGEELRQLVECVQAISPDSTIIISGDTKNRTEIPPSVSSSVRVIAGESSFTELATLLEHCRLYIGVDTGVTHLAGVLHVQSLVIAHTGTSNWLPYYNDRATILYHVANDPSEIYEGRAYLESKRIDRPHYLERVPAVAIETALKKLLVT